MSRDWQVGDKAVCVKLDKAPTRLEVGRVYTVIGFNLNRPKMGLGLLLAEVDPEAPYIGFHVNRFRKVLPDTHEPCEAEFVTLLERSKVPAIATLTEGGDVKQAPFMSGAGRQASPSLSLSSGSVAHTGEGI